MQQHKGVGGGLTMACSILLSMATTLAPEELQEQREKKVLERMQQRLSKTTPGSLLPVQSQNLFRTLKPVEVVIHFHNS